MKEQAGSRVPWGWWDALWTLLGSLVAVAALVVLLVIVLVGLTATGALGSPQAALQSAPALLLLTMAVYAGVWLVAVWFTVRKYRLPWAALGYQPRPAGTLLACAGLALPTLVASMLLNLAIAYLFLGGQFPNPQEDLLRLRLGSPLAGGLLLLLLAVVAPLVEETLFRGLLFQLMDDRWGTAPAIVGSAAAFALAHFIPLLLPALFLVGLVLAFVFARTRSLWCTVVLHGVHNGIVGVLLLAGIAGQP